MALAEVGRNQLGGGDLNLKFVLQLAHQLQQGQGVQVAVIDQPLVGGVIVIRIDLFQNFQQSFHSYRLLLF